MNTLPTAAPLASLAALGALATAVVAVSGCATKPPAPPPAPPPMVVPEALKPPAGQVLLLEAQAIGSQVYECAATAGRPGEFEWAFLAPEAQLADAAGQPVASHYAGPTWEAPDGSNVVGEVKARDAGPDRSAIPWLLLGAKSTSGTGVFTPVTFVQRLRTIGGLAPATRCAAGNLKQVVRVPYTATYYFYRAP